MNLNLTDRTIVNPMRKSVVIFLLFVLSKGLFAQQWNQEDEKTNVTFTIKNFGILVKGNFNSSNIQTNLTCKDLKKSYINAVVVVNSIDTGIKSRDRHLLNREYFNAVEHKKVSLNSTRIQENKDGSLLLEATLKIKEFVKKIAIPLEISETDSSIKIRTDFVVNRQDFDIGKRPSVLSDKVKVHVEFSGTK